MYTYFHNLTKEEALLANAKRLESANNWWETLNDNDKVLVENMLSSVIKQRNCNHTFVKGVYYDDPIEFCKECDIKK